jgi:hypothetical protein
MEPAFFVLAILGCGDAGNLCSEARVLPARYTSIQACQAAAPAVLAGNTDLDFPSLAASCRSNTARIAIANTTPRG